MATYFKLPNAEPERWELIEHKLRTWKRLGSVQDITSLIKGVGCLDSTETLVALSVMANIFGEEMLASIVESVRLYALRLHELFPSGNIQRLDQTYTTVKLRRNQALCLLCHMFLLTPDKGRQNLYWVDFKIWLTDERPCAVAYLQTLLEYFRQALLVEEQVYGGSDFMKEVIVFQRHEGELNELLTILKDKGRRIPIIKVELRASGSIGDETNSAELDFANADIGFGATGTQEEILFGSSPELCVAMLFSDTLQNNEAIVIRGARRVSRLEGYGLNLKFGSSIPFGFYEDWRKRAVVCIDALEFVAGDTFTEQLIPVNVTRDLLKAYVGFSAVSSSSTSSTEITHIATGHWGCGAYGGDKQLKAVIQLIAASAAASAKMLYYCFDDSEFYEEFKQFLKLLHAKQVDLHQLWTYTENLHTKQDISGKIFDRLAAQT